MNGDRSEGRGVTNNESAPRANCTRPDHRAPPSTIPGPLPSSNGHPCYSMIASNSGLKIQQPCGQVNFIDQAEESLGLLREKRNRRITSLYGPQIRNVVRAIRRYRIHGIDKREEQEERVPSIAMKRTSGCLKRSGTIRGTRLGRDDDAARRKLAGLRRQIWSEAECTVR